jgi:hypothetical protein
LQFNFMKKSGSIVAVEIGIPEGVKRWNAPNGEGPKWSRSLKIRDRAGGIAVTPVASARVRQTP